MSFLIALLEAVAEFALLAYVGIFFGVLEQTTDKEFKSWTFYGVSFLRMSSEERHRIFALAAVMGIIMLSSEQLTDVAWLNWTLLGLASAIEAYYLVWTLRISSRIREMVTGSILLVATWPVFASLSANLCAYDDIDSGPLGWMKLFVVACVAVLIITVAYRLYRSATLGERTRPQIQDFIPKEEKSHEV